MGEWKKTECNFCGLACGLEAYVEDNRIKNVRPDPESVRTPHGYCCRKGRSAHYFQDSEDRLNYPLKKVNGEFVRISWEQAIQEIAEKAKAIIAEHGPRSFAFVGGALATDQSDVAFIKPMTRALGSQYVYNPVGLEFAGNWWSHGRVMGHQGLYTEADDKHVEVFIAWGSNAYVSHQLQEARSWIREMSERPDKMLILVDPRCSETARMADMHIMLRNSSDALFLRGLISYIIDMGWQDQAYLDKWCSDWEDAKKWYINFDYKRAFEICHVPFEQAQEFAKILTTKTWGLHQDLGIFCSRNNTANSYLLLTLMAVTGCLQVKGNVSLQSFAFKGPLGDERDPDVWRTVETGVFPVTGVYPTACLADELMSEKEDRLRCVFTTVANPARSYSDSKKINEGLDRLELLVVSDIVMTETARHADYVLPGMTGFEAYQWSTFQPSGPEISCMLKHSIIEPIAERRENCRAWLEIARAMGIVPEMDKEVYEAAVKSVEKRDLCVFMPKFLGYMKKHLDYKPYAPLMMADALSRPEAMGSVPRAFLRCAFATSPLSGSGAVERAGFKARLQYRPLKLLKKTRALYNLSTMDQAFWAVDDNPSGVIIGYSNPDPEEFMKEVCFYEDKKIRLWDETMEHYLLENITPEVQEQELALSDEYPILLSSGNHADGGDNTSMSNSDTYVYRNPFTLLINPKDAKRLEVTDEEPVRLVTKAGSGILPAELSYRARPGYCLIPHQFGLLSRGKRYGIGANEFMSSEDRDPITQNPYIRYVRARVEKLTDAEKAELKTGDDKGRPEYQWTIEK